jgi:hypothetical protein
VPLSNPTFTNVPTGSGYTITGNQADDLLILCRYRDGNSNAWASPPVTGATLISSGGVNSNSMDIRYVIASGTSDITWNDNGSGTYQFILRFRGGTPTVGNVAATSDATTTVTYPSRTLTHTDGRSFVYGIAGCRSTTGTLETAPSGMTNLFHVDDGTQQVAVHTTGSATADWTSTDASIGGSASGWRAVVLEIIGDSAPSGGFTTTGALAAQAAVVAGTAVHLTLHTTTGALAAQAATVSGAAVSPHLSTGALAAQAAVVAGTSAHLTLHTTSGALEAQAAVVAGDAAYEVSGTDHAASGALTAQSATVAGSAAHLTLHTSTGALSAQAATVAGSAAHLTLHTTTGELVAGSAQVSGVAFIGDEPPPAEVERGNGTSSGFVRARKAIERRLHLQRLLDHLTEEEPAAETKRIIRAVKAGKPIPADPKPPAVMPEVSASKLADKIIPSRIAAVEQAQAQGLDIQRVVLRAIQIARERDDEEVMLLL